MLVKLSSKGQLVIPKSVRQQLQLKPHTQLHLYTTSEGEIVLTPARENVLTTLYGKYRDADMLTELETEHAQEISDELTDRA